MCAWRGAFTPSVFFFRLILADWELLLLPSAFTALLLITLYARACVSRVGRCLFWECAREFLTARYAWRECGGNRWISLTEIWSFYFKKRTNKPNYYFLLFECFWTALTQCGFKNALKA